MVISPISSAHFGVFGPPAKLSVVPKPTRHLPPSAVSEISHSRRLQLISEREGEDATITGGTRSLQRRLLALNLQDPTRVSPSKVGAAIPQPLSA